MPAPDPLHKVTIAILDERGSLAAIESAILKGFGVGRVSAHETLSHLMSEMRIARPDALIINWSSLDQDCLSIITTLRDEIQSPDPYTPIILVTPASYRDRVMDAIAAGIDTVLTLPMRPIDVYAHLIHLTGSERVFIRAPGYFGPERRRRDDPHYDGPERRLGQSRSFERITQADVEAWRRKQRQIAKAQLMDLDTSTID